MRVHLADKKIRIRYTAAPVTYDRGSRLFCDKMIGSTGVLLYENDYILYNFIEILSLFAAYDVQGERFHASGVQKGGCSGDRYFAGMGRETSGCIGISISSGSLAIL